METNSDEDPSLFLTFCISSAFQKWNELKLVLTENFYENSNKNFGSLCEKPSNVTAVNFGSCQLVN